MCSRKTESPIPKEGHRKVLLTIDLTPAVMNEALSLGQVGAIIAYHPPIFSGLKSVSRPLLYFSSFASHFV